MSSAPKKPHAVCMAVPGQSHVTAMLKFAKLIHSKGFFITFVNTEDIHKRMFESRAISSIEDLPDFCFQTIPDGIAASPIDDAAQNSSSLCYAILNNFSAPLQNLICKLNNPASSSVPPVTCLITDGFASSAFSVGKELGIPTVLLYTVAACSLMGFKQCRNLMDKGILPFKDDSYLRNGYMDMTIDWIPGMKNIRVKDLPACLRTTDPNDLPLKVCMEGAERAVESSAVVVHTFQALEGEVLAALSSMLPRVFSIGPLHLLLNQIPESPLKSLGSSLWKEEIQCLQWLDAQTPNSVVYVNFGSVVKATQQQMVELAWGLANSNHPFLWVTRPDLVDGGPAVLPPEFVEETKDRGLLVTGWCPQEDVLNHPSVAAFLTHCGWNSVMESLCAGVPIIGCPLLWEQNTNCRFACEEWGMGLEIDSDIKREQVASSVMVMLEEEKGQLMKSQAMEWKHMAEAAVSPHGSSTANLDALVRDVLL